MSRYHHANLPERRAKGFCAGRAVHPRVGNWRQAVGFGRDRTGAIRMRALLRPNPSSETINRRGLDTVPTMTFGYSKQREIGYEF